MCFTSSCIEGVVHLDLDDEPRDHHVCNTSENARNEAKVRPELVTPGTDSHLATVTTTDQLTCKSHVQTKTEQIEYGVRMISNNYDPEVDIQLLKLDCI